MNEFIQGVLVFVSGWAFWKFLNYYLESKIYFQLFASITFLFVFAYFLIDLIPIQSTDVNIFLILEWTRVAIAAFSLTAMAFIIRNSKPHFARFPFSFGLAPLLLIPFYVLAIDTVFLKELVLDIYFGGAIFIAILVYSLKTMRNSDFGLVLLSTIVVLLAFILQWLPVAIQNEVPWIQNMLFVLAIGLFVKPFQDLYLIQDYDYQLSQNEDL